MSSLHSASALCVLGGLALAWRLYRERTNRPSWLPLPPGPKGYPLIDNLLDFPTYKPWLEYTEWNKLYGDVVYFKVLGQPFLIVGSAETAFDLFDKRSSNYSDRPRLPMINEMMAWTFSPAMLPYGSWWRRHRRLFHDYFHPNIVHRYNPILLEATRAFLREFLRAPDGFVSNIQHLFSSTILKITYGITPKFHGDPLVELSEIALAGLTVAGNPGSFLVDLIPAMMHIPEWFPGTQWKKKAAYWRHINERLVNDPWDLVMKQVKEGTAPPCIATSVINKLPEQSSPDRAEAEEIAKNVCAVAFAGGADTTASTVQSFFMAMSLYPDVQKKAQAELDKVLGGRLPDFNDRPSLPYVNAIVKESMRWQPVGPLAAAHMATEADEYKGYYIPKGTLVIGNSWGILHDPELYPDPSRYNPERFLTKDGQLDRTVRDPGRAAFGYGRRSCPGRFLSDNSMYLLVAHLLAVYDIRPTVDKDGKEIEIKPETTHGMLSYPAPFECRVTPRSKRAEELIRDSGLMN